MYNFPVLHLRIVDSNMNGFSNFPGNLFAISVYYLKVGGHVGLWVVVGNAMFVNCTGVMTIEFFHSVF